MKKRVIALSLAVLFALSMAAGCSPNKGGGDKQATTGNATTAGKTATAAPTQVSLYPVVTNGSITLSYWLPIQATAVQYIKSYAENIAYQEVQKATGIKINFIHPTVGQEKEQFSIMIASGDIPDMVQNAHNYTGGVLKGFQDGVFKDLMPYLKTNAPDYYALINKDDEVKRETQVDGKVVAFYMLNEDLTIPYERFLLRQDWLDEFGLKTPRTLDDYENYFKAIQKNKPGVAPFTNNANYKKQWLGAYDMIPDWYVVNGKIQHYYDNPKLLEYLTLMNKWYKVGYLSKDFTSMSASQVNAAFDSGTLGMYYESVDAAYSRTSKLSLKLGSVPFPRLKDDQQIHTAPPSFPVDPTIPMTTAVSSKCKNVEAAVKFLNYGYSEKGARTYNFGVEGVTYTMVNGKPSYTDFMLNPKDNMTQSNTSYIYKIHLGPKLKASDLICAPAMVKDPAVANWRKKWSDDPKVDASYNLPPITLKTDENSRRAEIMTNVDTYATEMQLKFITGAEPLSSFDNYLKQLDKLNFQEAKKITQTAYDRYYGK